MKKKNLILIVFALVLMLSACRNSDYDAANKKTQSMTDYTMKISTIITIEDNENIKQSIINQVLRVNAKGEAGMLYDVKTTATSTDMLTGEAVSEENSYMFYENSYYYTYPGVRYKSAAEYDMALSNIENLTDVISFSENKMLNVEWEEGDGESVINYQVNYADASPFVKSVLENAIATFEGLEFSPKDMSASARLKDNAVTGRELYICYEAMTGERVTIEIYTEYDNAETIEKPDESKYVNIMG